MFLYGMALTQDGHIVVADWGNHRLQVLTVEGAFVSAVGSRGSRPLQFKNALAIHHNLSLMVVTVVFRSLTLTSLTHTALVVKEIIQESSNIHVE